MECARDSVTMSHAWNSSILDPCSSSLTDPNYQFQVQFPIPDPIPRDPGIQSWYPECPRHPERIQSPIRISSSRSNA